MAASGLFDSRTTLAEAKTIRVNLCFRVKNGEARLKRLTEQGLEGGSTWRAVQWRVDSQRTTLNLLDAEIANAEDAQ